MQCAVKKMYNCIKNLALTLIAASVIINFSFYFNVTANAQPNTVKVGYFDYPGFFFTDSDGNISGYYYEYLMKMSNITGWKYEFVKGSLSQCYNMLKNGEIDIFVPTQKTDDDVKFFDYSDKDFRKCFAALYVSEDSPITFEDYDSFKNLRVGMLKGSNLIGLFNTYQKQHNFSVIPFIYENEADQTQALKNNEIDAILSLNLRKSDGEKIVARIGKVNLYYVTNKKNQGIMEKLNFALSKIDYDEPNYETDLYQKYFYRINSNFISFTSGETEFIKKYKKIKAVYDPNWYPFEYYDKKTKNFSGTTAKIFDLLSIYSGLEFEFVQSKSLSESINMLNSGQADIICGIVNSAPRNSNIKLTDYYYSAPFVYLSNENSLLNKDAVIALPQKYETLKDIEKHLYPDIKFDSSYNSIKDALKAVKKNKNMAVIENSYLANNLIMAAEYYDLGILALTGNAYATHIGVSDKVDSILLSILNKSISRISEIERNKIMLSSNGQVNNNLTTREFIKVYNDKIIASILTVFILIIFVYIDNRRRSYFKLKKLAYTDSLTGGSNLARFKYDANKLFSAYGFQGYAIVSIDIDKFKYINEMFGYQEGDKIIKSIYNTLAANIGSNELCARCSADWFVMMLRAANLEALTSKIEKTLKEISLIQCPGSEYYEIISKCGIYLIEPGEKDINIMLDKALMTRETIKSGHRNTYVFYTDKLKENIKKEKDAENSMMKALANEEFIVFLQPKFDLQTRNIVGAEALVRWRHPCKGILSPIEFIPFFEKNGFIVSLDFYIFETVCRQIRWWLDNGYSPLPVSVNISRVNLYRSDFVEKYKSTVEKYNIPSELLELELTESAIFENQNIILSIANEFKKAGISMSIDDFRSGYSCLSLLGTIPFETLKIDRSFLTNNYYTDGGKTVVKKIVELAKLLNIKVVSEGVETNEQEEFLRSIGCDMAQGYLFAHPMPVDNFNNLICNNS